MLTRTSHSYYFGTIALGNPAVAFELQLDTGSAVSKFDVYTHHLI